MASRVTIERLGHRGDGIAPGPVFVPRALPGEVVDLATGKPRILAPSDQRVKAACAHYGACGGCALQHARDTFVAAWKVDVVRQALAAQGLHPPVVGVHTSPPHSRRRATFSLKRTKSGEIVGFHAPASEAIIDTPSCLLLHPQVQAARPALARIARIGASRKGALSATVTCLSNGLDVAVRGGKPLTAALQAELAALAPGILRLTWEGELLAQAERPVLRVDGVAVSPPPGAFLQATAEGEAALRQAVHDAVGTAEHVADLFAGIGTFALPLARGAKVHAVEGDAAMTEALLSGWRQGAGLKRVTAEARDLFRRPLEPDELARFDALVLDPPRAGAEALGASRCAPVGLCVVQPRQLRARCTPACGSGIPCRMGPRCGSIPLVAACRACSLPHALSYPGGVTATATGPPCSKSSKPSSRATDSAPSSRA